MQRVKIAIAVSNDSVTKNNCVYFRDFASATKYICTEEYTSKTCGPCGILNNVGSRDVFSYGLIDSDINGARNIPIKRLKELVLLQWSYT